MSSANQSYVLYAHPVAQPSRAVLWIAALTGFQYELKVTMPGLETGSAEYLDNVNPFGTIPCLVINDKESGKRIAAITDAVGIADFICGTTGEKGEAFLPKDPIVRAKVLSTWMFGAIGARTITFEIFRPLFVSFRTKQPCTLTQAQIDKFLAEDFEGKVVDLSRAAGWTVAKHDGSRDTLVENPVSIFLVPEAGNKPTIADFLNFAETYQLEVLGLLGDIYERRPAFKRWHDAMMKLPGFDKVHETLAGFVPLLKPFMPVASA